MTQRVIINGVEYIKPSTGGLLRVSQPNPLFAKFPKHGGVYCITCLITGKKYIGSSMNLRSRMTAYFSNTRKKQGVLRYLNPNKVTLDLLEDGKYLKKEQIRALELEWINKLNTAHPIGFNLKCPVTNVFLNNDCYQIKDKPGHSLRREESAYWLDGIEDKEAYRLTYNSKLSEQDILLFGRV